MRNPSPKEVKDIYKYCYLFFEKYKDAKKESEFNAMLDEAKKLQALYPFKMCETMLFEIINTIGSYEEVKNEL